MELEKTVTYRIQRQNKKGSIITIRCWNYEQEGRLEWNEQDFNKVIDVIKGLREQFKRDGYKFWIEKIIRITKITTVKGA